MRFRGQRHAIVAKPAIITFMNCEVCEIIQNSSNQNLTVINSTKWRVSLDPNQQNLGKCFVTLIAHKEKLSELDHDDWLEFSEIVKMLETNCDLAFSPHHFNWQCLMNDTALENNPAHVHWHFSPRYNNPVVFNNETFIDENYPRTNKNHRDTKIDTLKLIAEKLKNNYQRKRPSY